MQIILFLVWFILSAVVILAICRAAHRLPPLPVVAVGAAACFVLFHASAAEVSLLDRIALVESGNNPAAIGDGGRATGAWQMHAAARRDARKLLGRYGTDRELAQAYLDNLTSQLAAHLRRQPTPGECYAAWNLGIAGFQKRGFLISKCPSITQRAAARL